MEMKFKPGMKALSMFEGIITLRSYGEEEDLLCGPDGDVVYRPDGRYHDDDKYPVLLTFDEARAKGYEVPKEPRVVWVNFVESNENVFMKAYHSYHEASADALIPHKNTWVKEKGVKFIELVE